MKNFISVIALILVIAGALNWLLIGIFSFNLISFLLGPASVISRIIYGLVGVAALWLIGAHIANAAKSNNKQA